MIEESICVKCGKDVPGHWICEKCSEGYTAVELIDLLLDEVGKKVNSL